MRCTRSEGRTDGGTDSGMVTAELAMCLPVLVLLLGVALAAVSVGSLRVRAQDAATQAARAAARGDTALASALARGAAPGVSVRIEESAGTVTAIATLHEHLVLSFLPQVTVTGRAVAMREPDR